MHERPNLGLNLLRNLMFKRAGSIVHARWVQGCDEGDFSESLTSFRLIFGSSVAPTGIFSRGQGPLVEGL